MTHHRRLSSKHVFVHAKLIELLHCLERVQQEAEAVAEEAEEEAEGLAS